MSSEIDRPFHIEHPPAIPLENFIITKEQTGEKVLHVRLPQDVCNLIIVEGRNASRAELIQKMYGIDQQLEELKKEWLEVHPESSPQDVDEQIRQLRSQEADNWFEAIAIGIETKFAIQTRAFLRRVLFESHGQDSETTDKIEEIWRLLDLGRIIIEDHEGETALEIKKQREYPAAIEDMFQQDLAFVESLGIDLQSLVSSHARSGAIRLFLPKDVWSKIGEKVKSTIPREIIESWTEEKLESELTHGIQTYGNVIRHYLIEKYEEEHKDETSDEDTPITAELVRHIWLVETHRVILVKGPYQTRVDNI